MVFLTNHKALQSKTKATQITFDTQSKIAHEKTIHFPCFQIWERDVATKEHKLLYHAIQSTNLIQLLYNCYGVC